MATRFELVLHGDDPVRLRASGEEALREIVRLEDTLSYYRPAGALGRLNRALDVEPVRVPAPLFHLLVRAGELWERTGGAFDVTIAPLMQCWGMTGGVMHRPTATRLEEALARSGFAHVRLDAATRMVRRLVRGMAIDLGGIAKGYAIDEAMALLADHGVPGALLHGGTSTIAATGTSPEGSPWLVGIPMPGSVIHGSVGDEPVDHHPGDRGSEGHRPDGHSPGSQGSGGPGSVLCTVVLRDQALSVSEVRGKGFEDSQGFHGHVLDPRTGRPTRRGELAAVRAATATDSDALATALLVLGDEFTSAPAFDDPNVSFLVATTPGNHAIRGRGLFSTLDVR